MLIHTSQKQAHHQAIADSVKKWLLDNRDKIVDECGEIYREEASKFTISNLREVFPDYEHPDSDIWGYPEYEQIKPGIMELLSEISSIMLDDEGDLQTMDMLKKR